jgi:hypothetical protein
MRRRAAQPRAPVAGAASSVLDLKFARFWIDLRANFKSNKHTREFKRF